MIDSDIDISIIIPAYNAMPELTRTLQSLVDQSYNHDRMQVIVIDDGSNDGTWEEARRFAVNHPALFTLLQLPAASGSPARPRNLGIDNAVGTYLFFLDADDWLGSLAVEKMLAHAKEWNSDVLYVRLKGEGGASCLQFAQRRERREC